MKIGITGATGKLGQLVLDKLKSQVPRENIVALVRSPEKAADFDVEVREADYDKPDTLENALQGIHKLLLISGSEVGKRAAQHRNVIEAAKKNNVKWIVYTSLLHADTSTLSLAEEHLVTEKALEDSGIPYTLLRNGWYTENYTGSIPGALAGGALIGSAGNGKIASATRADYADAAVTVLTGEGYEGKTFELAGDDIYTLEEMAREISRQTGKDIPYKNLSEEEYSAALQEFGVPKDLADSIAGWDKAASRGDLLDNSRQLSELIGRTTTPMPVAVAKALEDSQETKE